MGIGEQFEFEKTGRIDPEQPKDCDHALGSIDFGNAFEQDLQTVCLSNLHKVIHRADMHDEFNYCPLCGDKLDLDKYFKG